MLYSYEYGNLPVRAVGAPVLVRLHDKLTFPVSLCAIVQTLLV